MIGAVDPEQGTGGGGSENVVLEGEGDLVSSCDCSQATQTVKMAIYFLRQRSLISTFPVTF